MRNLRPLLFLLLLAFVVFAGLAFNHSSHHETQNENMAKGDMENMGVFLRSI